MQIRSWDEADTDWWVGLRLAWQPMMSSDAQLRLLAAGKIARFAYRAVAWEEEARVGFASIAIPPGHDDSMALVLVPEDKRGKGIGSRLFADLLLHTDGQDLTASMGDDDPVGLAVAQHWGFQVVSHAIRSRYDVRHDPAPARGNRSPYTFRVIDARSPAADRTWLAPLIRKSDTSPESVDLGWHATLADLETMFPNIVWVVIEDQGLPLAAASAAPRTDEAWLVIYTGVLPDHRREGLARLAKQQLHTVVAERGATTLTTENEARNSGIRALNASLGYEVVGGEIRLRRAGSAPRTPRP